MVDRHEGMPDEYPLPVVGGEAANVVMDAIVVGDDGVSERVTVNAQAEFEFMRRHNPEIFEAIAGTIESTGLLDAETAGAAKLGMGVTHALLHAQARVDKGLPPIDPDSDEYHLPVVTREAALSFFTGEAARQRAMGAETPFDDFQEHNPFIPFILRNVSGLPIGTGMHGGAASYVAEFAAITTQGLLREQATMDAFAGGNGPLG